MPSLALGVGHNPNPVSFVGGSDGPSTHHKRPAGVARFFQPFEDHIGPATPESRNVFKEAKTGSGSTDNAEHFKPEAGPWAADANPVACGADVLTWESPANNVNCSSEVFSINFPHIAQVWNVRPVLGKHLAGVGLDFGKGDGFTARRFKGQSEPTDPAE